MTKDERIKMKPKMIYDLEVSPNYFLIGMMKIDDGEIIQYDVRGKNNKLSKKKIKKVMELLNNFTFVGFNSLNYDSPVLAEMLLVKRVRRYMKYLLTLLSLMVNVGIMIKQVRTKLTLWKLRQDKHH